MFTLNNNNVFVLKIRTNQYKETEIKLHNFDFPILFSHPGEKKIETTIENCPKSTIANYKRLQI